MGQINSKYDLNREELQKLLVSVDSEFEKPENYGENVPEEVLSTRKKGVKNIVNARVSSDFSKILDSIQLLKLDAHTNKPRASAAGDFIAIPLFKSNEVNLKIHIFPPHSVCEKQFHTHKYSVISAVVKGSLEEDIGTPIEGTKYDVFGSECLDGACQMDHVKLAHQIDLSVEHRTHSGTIYAVPNTYYHEVENKELTISFCIFIQKGSKNSTFLELKDKYNGIGKDVEKIYEAKNWEKFTQEGLDYLIKNYS